VNNRRFMIRLIDIALIILFGFIAISGLKTEYVNLPSGSNSQVTKQWPHEATLHIYGNYFVLQDTDREEKLRNLQDLEVMMIEVNNYYLQKQYKFVIKIEPHKSSIMQSLIDVFDICQRNNIDKNLNYDAI